MLFYAYGVVTVPMEETLGLTRAATSSAFSLALLTSGLAAWSAGRHVDRRGARGLMTLGSIIGALLVFAWSFVQTLPQLLVVQAGIGLAIAAVTYDVAFTVLARWFRRDRMRAILLVTLAAGFASTIFVPLTTLLTEAWGWRAALRALALLLLVVTAPLHALTLRRDPRDLGLAPDGTHDEDPGDPARDRTEEPTVTLHGAVRRAPFWWLTTAFALDTMALLAIAAHAVPLLLERGQPASLVALAVGSIGAWQVAGRLVFAPATERVPLRTLTIVTYLTRAVSLALILAMPGLTGMFLFASLFGLANGASTLARAGIVAEVFGARHYGAINGAMSGLVVPLRVAAPLAVGALRTSTGGYDLALAIGIVIVALAALAVAQVTSRPPLRPA